MNRRFHAPFVVAVFALTVFALGVVTGARITNRNGAPGSRSVDVGFARSMVQHHAQAVEMADVIRSRSTDPQIILLATDIVLTQQNQIGRMEALLDTWGVTLTSTEEPMAWMGHSGPMPGMASRADIESLNTLPVADAETTFLRLMIDHHRGGIDMAQSALSRGVRREVRQLAVAIVAGQQAEIDAMQQLLAQERPRS